MRSLSWRIGGRVLQGASAGGLCRGPVEFPQEGATYGVWGGVCERHADLVKQKSETAITSLFTLPPLSGNCGIVNIPKSHHWGPSQIQLKQTQFPYILEMFPIPL